LVSAVVVSAVGGGCSKKDDAAMTVDQFCQQYAQRECAAVAPLCGYTTASCEPTRTKDCQTRIMILQTATGGMRPFRSANAPACLDKVTAAYAKLPITGAVGHDLQQTCARVFQGTGKSLDPCASDLDCDGTLICDKGRCAAKAQVAAGALCANPGETCVAGESCKTAPGGGVLQCSPRRAAGEACSTADPCVEALRCVGTCVDRVVAGTPCAQDDDCASDYCSPYTQKCSAGQSFAEGSDSCAAYTGALPADGATD
jgi:hypothetical protein